MPLTRSPRHATPRRATPRLATPRPTPPRPALLTTELTTPAHTPLTTRRCRRRRRGGGGGGGYLWDRGSRSGRGWHPGAARVALCCLSVCLSDVLLFASFFLASCFVSVSPRSFPCCTCLHVGCRQRSKHSCPPSLPLSLSFALGLCQLSSRARPAPAEGRRRFKSGLMCVYMSLPPPRPPPPPPPPPTTALPPRNWPARVSHWSRSTLQLRGLAASAHHRSGGATSDTIT